MRGARQRNRRKKRRPRIIPADAGSTYGHSFKTVAGKDHPRGCGEHGSADQTNRLLKGSSPRMRGALNQIIVNLKDMRIIPADAGSTATQPSQEAAPEDHPRGCGEHIRPFVQNSSGEGSSPRMRGARISRPDKPVVEGIIPADAGSTLKV